MSITNSPSQRMSKTHQWFVARGRVEISKDKSGVLLELDPEGSAYCVLSVQDANEMAGILENEARDLWASSDEAIGRAAQVDGDPSVSCELMTSAGTLQAMVHDSKPFVALACDSNAACRLDAAQAVALVQILQRMAATTGSRAA